VTSDPASQLLAAQRLLAENRVEDAVDALRALVGGHPRYLQAKYELAIACAKLGALDEAVGLFTEVCTSNPTGLRSLEFHDALRALPDYRKALDVVETLLPLLPGATKMIELLGELLRKRAQDDGLPNGDIEVVGDSHAVANFASIVRCRVHCLGPLTMHHMARQPIDLAGLGIAPGARLVTVFGEIDCRSHMVGMAQQSPADALVRRLAAGFVGSLERTIARGSPAAVAICSILPPPRDYPDNPLFPAIGSAEQRREMALLLNRALDDAARGAGIFFLDIRPAYTDADGFLDPAKSDGLVHVDFRQVGPIAERLAELFARAPSA
jgi:tetratricopeptide (TPR) repeat protein